MANKIGTTKTVNGQKKRWNGRRWVPVGSRSTTRTPRNSAPGTGRSRASRSTTTRTSNPTTRTPRQAMNADLDSSYRVLGITYDRSTGRPIDVPENRRPVVAKTPPKKTPPKNPPTKNPPTKNPPTSDKKEPAKKKPRTWLADNYKPGKGPARRSTAGSAKNKPKQSKRMADALNNLKVRKY